MPKVKSDLFFIPKSSSIFRIGAHSGIARTSMVFSKNKIFILPFDIQRHSTRKIETERFTFDDQVTHKGLGDRFEQSGIEPKELEQWITNAGLEKEHFIYDISNLKDLKIKPGLLGGSIMFRSPEDNGREVFSCSKKDAKELNEFLGR